MMPHQPNQSSSKGKEVVDEHRTPKRSRTSNVPRAQTGLSIREPPDATCYSSSDDEEEPNQMHTTLVPTHSTLTRTMSVQGEGSNGRKAGHRVTSSSASVTLDQANRGNMNDTPAHVLARRERDRARYASRTPEQVENQRQRARARYASMTPEQRQVMRSQQNSRNTSRRSTPRQDSIIGSSDPAATNASVISSNSIGTSEYVYQNLPDTTRNVDESPAHVSARRESDRARYASRTPEQVENRRQRARARYAGMTPEQRQAIRRQQNSRNASRRSTPAATNASAIGSNSIDTSEHVYQNLPDTTHMLKARTYCLHYGAKRFEYESPGFCCQNGKVNLSTSEPPDELRMLYTSSDSNAKHFRDSIRYFNGHFSFTTLVVHLDNNYANMRDGVYTFRAHGQIYHNIHSFGPSDGGLDHLELYFYDDDTTLQHRFRRSQNLDQYVIRRLVDILRDNPYSQTFRSLGGVKDLAEYRVTLNTDVKLDQRTHNRPITSEVAAVWIEGNELVRKFDRSITLFGNNNKRYSIRPHYGCYDPLSYPLFFPRGELGWHPEIPRPGVPLSRVLQSRSNNHHDPDTNSRLCVSVREYYCYKFQMRHGIFNSILYGQRLFQQFVVDTYIKVETTRLNWIIDHQKELF